MGKQADFHVVRQSIYRLIGNLGERRRAGPRAHVVRGEALAFGCREGVERCAGTDLVAAATASVAGEQSVPKQEVTIVFDATSAPHVISGVATHGTPIHHEGRSTGDVDAAAQSWTGPVV